jgi:dTMP kinase
MFITFEGGEGTGKSSQALRLRRRLVAAGYTVRLTREPGGTPLADGIRALFLHPDASLQALAAAHLAADAAAEPMLPMTQLLLLSAARAQHVARIRGWLASGEVVVSDRYADATRVYQGVGHGLDATTIATAERLATDGVSPDLTLLLDLTVEEGQLRRRRAEQLGEEWNWLDAETRAFHERVRQGYLHLAAAEQQRWVVLDAGAAEDEVELAVWGVVQDRLRSDGTP